MGFWDHLTLCVLRPPSIRLSTSTQWHHRYHHPVTEGTKSCLLSLSVDLEVSWHASQDMIKSSHPCVRQGGIYRNACTAPVILTLALNVVEFPLSHPSCYTHWTPVGQHMSRPEVSYRYDANRWQMLSDIAILLRFTFLMQESMAPSQSWNFQHLALSESKEYSLQQKLLACVHLFYYVIYFC